MGSCCVLRSALACRLQSEKEMFGDSDFLYGLVRELLTKTGVQRGPQRLCSLFLSVCLEIPVKRCFEPFSAVRRARTLASKTLKDSGNGRFVSQPVRRREDQRHTLVQLYRVLSVDCRATLTAHREANIYSIQTKRRPWSKCG